MFEMMISQEMKQVWPETALACIRARVRVEESCAELCRELETYCAALQQSLQLDGITALPAVADGREAYKKLGKAPSKYRLSSEALLRRVLQGKGVYRINNVVEINNLLSLKSKFPVGSYDLAKVETPLLLRPGRNGEQYQGIGKAEINMENLPLLCDASGCFGSPTSDSERAMIMPEAEEIMLCIYSFSGKAGLKEYLTEAQKLLEKYAFAREIKMDIFE